MSDYISIGIEEGIIIDNVVSQTGGHGDFRPRQAPTHSLCCSPHEDFHVLANGVDGVTLATRELIRKGAQHIKVSEISELY